MPGKSEKLSIIDKEGATDYVVSQLYRPADTSPPSPIGDGLVINDLQAGVRLVVDDAYDRPFDFNTFIAYRHPPDDFDTNGNPIGDPEEVVRFTSSTKFVSQPEGTKYRYAIRVRDHAGNLSGYSSWKLGISLRESGIMDRFDRYGGADQIINDVALDWLEIARVEPSEGWSLTLSASYTHFDNQHVAEGDYSLYIALPDPTLISFADLSRVFDLDVDGRFTDDDYVTVVYYVEQTVSDGSTVASLRVGFLEDTSNFFYADIDFTNTTTTGWHAAAIKKSDFSSSGSPDWANISLLRFGLFRASGSGTQMPILHVDDWRIVKASTLTNPPVEYSDTGDVWVPQPDDNLADDAGTWHVYRDMPGQDFALGLVAPRSGETYDIYREDRLQAEAIHACAIQLRSPGQAGMLFRVQQPTLLAEAAHFNAMFTNSLPNPVGRTHSLSAAGLTYANDTTLGAYAVFTSGDELSYNNVIYGPTTHDDLTYHIAFRPSFAYNTASDVTLFHHYRDANYHLKLWYDATNDRFEATWYFGSPLTTRTLQTSAQTFAANTDMTLTLTMDDDGLATLYLNGQAEDSYLWIAAPPGSPFGTSGTLYVSNNNTSGEDFAGRIYQVLVDFEAMSATEALAAYSAMFGRQSLSQKVASPSQRSYYSYEIDTANDEITLRLHRIGFDIADVATALSQKLYTKTAYYLAVDLTDIDNNNDADADAVKLVAYLSTNGDNIFDGDNQTFNLTISTDPLFTGGVGFRSEATNVRFSNFRAGSPQRAEEAERAVFARTARRVALPDVIGTYKVIPGLRGLWLMGPVDGSGGSLDESPGDRDLTYNGNPIYGRAGRLPYLRFDGTGDYLSRTDEVALSIDGTESYFDNPGLTVCGWVYFDNTTPALSEGLITKDDASTQRSYTLFRLAVGTVRFGVSSDGSTLVSVTSSGATEADKWHFVAGRYKAGELAVWLDATKRINTTSIPTSIYDGTANFIIGAFSTGSLRLSGRVGPSALYASALLDEEINDIYEMGKLLLEAT